MNKAGLIVFGSIAGLVAAAVVISKGEDVYLDYLYDHGRYQDFLNSAPRGDPDYEAKRMRAISELVKKQCLAIAPELVQKIGSLRTAGQWEEMGKVQYAGQCARFIPTVGETLQLAPAKIKEKQAAELFAKNGGKAAFLHKAEELARTKPRDAAVLLKPFDGLQDPQTDALIKVTTDRVTALDRAENARTIARAHAAELAERKRQGVRVGMSRERVLESSWGRPEHINRTTNAFGEHEQWVYGGGNYLYFDNGVLTTIQN